MQNPTINQEDMDFIGVPFLERDLHQFMEDMFDCYISQNSYDANTGKERSRHFQMYSFLTSTISINMLLKNAGTIYGNPTS